MRRSILISLLTLSIVGCGDNDGDDAAVGKKPLAMDQVPAAVLKAAQEAAPDLTFYAAYNDKFDGQDSIELKGKTKSGKIREIEVSPAGKVLGSE